MKNPIFRMTQHCRIRYYERVLNEPWNGFCKAEKELWQTPYLQIEGRKALGQQG